MGWRRWRRRIRREKRDEVLQAGWRLSQRHWHARGVRGSEQKRSDGQSEHQELSGIMVAATPADRAAEAWSRGGGGGVIGARSARGLLQSGQRRRQQHQHVTGVRGSGQKRSDSQGERHARSGIIMTAAVASTAIETLDGVATAAAATTAREAR